MPNHSEFGNEVRARMKAARIRQKEFALRVDLSESSISSILAGNRPIPAEHAAFWAAALDLEGDAFSAFVEMMHVHAAGPIVADLVARLRAENRELRDIRDKCARRMDQTQRAFDLMKERIAKAGE